MRIKCKVLFKNKGQEETRNIILDHFNDHADDKKALWSAGMAEVRKKWPKDTGFVQRITLRK